MAFDLIVKVQTSFTAPPMALVYDEHGKVEGQFPAKELPDYAQTACKKNGGKAYFRGELVGSKIRLGTQVPEQPW